MVGAVIVHNNVIIGEGYHQEYGGPHAEVNAINNVKDKSLLKNATIFVSLEPCSHFGKTPPCSDLIIKHKIPKVVIATLDSNAVVCGNGITKLKAAGIEVITGVLEKEANQLNSAFNTFHTKKRPYIILKWAETKDGFIDSNRTSSETPSLKISNSSSSRWVHKLRSETQAILVGTRTALLDNPALTTRKWAGKNPIRIVIDTELKLPKNLHLFDGTCSTLVFNAIKSETDKNIEYIKISNDSNYIESLLHQLWERNIQSVLVEGGSHTLQQFIDKNLWDSTYRISTSLYLKEGVKSPKFTKSASQTLSFGDNKIHCYGKDI
jgi:diaminohydroxyphosphoribosylaminopyrimidine deaminase/5-amino-6-(5-phosphoribosylamino)uracil reductase